MIAPFTAAAGRAPTVERDEQPLADDVRITIIRDAAELEQLRAAWDRLEQRALPETVFLTHTYLIPRLVYLATLRPLHVACVWSGQQLVALFPLVEDTVRMGPVRRRRLALATTGYQAPTLDVRVCESHAAASVRRLLTHAEPGVPPWAILSFRHLSMNSPLLRTLPRLCRELGLWVVKEPSRREAYVHLEDSWDAQVDRLHSKFRKSLRRAYRAFDKTPGWKMTHTWPTEAEWAGIIPEYWDTVRRSWKSAECDDRPFVAFLNDVARAFAREGRLMVSRTTGPSGCDAAELHFLRERTLTPIHMAFDAACPVPGAGTLLMADALRYATEHGFSLYDCASGADHLNRWAPVYRNTCHVHILRRGPTGAALRFGLARRRKNESRAGRSGPVTPRP